MAKKKKEQKYENGVEVKTLVGKGIKDGYVFENSKGIVKSYSDTTFKYKVEVVTTSGGSVLAEYYESELMLANLSIDESNKRAEELKEIIKKNKRICTFIGISLMIFSLLVIVTMILTTFFVKDQLAMILTISGCMIVLFAGAVVAMIFNIKVNKKAIAASRELETMFFQNSAEVLYQEENKEKDNVLSQIDKLKELLDKGAISEMEYQEAKAELLKRL